MRTAGRLADPGECLAEVVGDGIGGGDGAGADLDLNRAVAAGGLGELPDGPASLCLDPAADGEDGEDDSGAPRWTRACGGRWAWRRSDFDIRKLFPISKSLW